MDSLNRNPTLAQRLREVLQETALAGLVRRGFWGKAAFYGGTCLSIFHGLLLFSGSVLRQAACGVVSPMAAAGEGPRLV